MKRNLLLVVTTLSLYFLTPLVSMNDEKTIKGEEDNQTQINKLMQEGAGMCKDKGIKVFSLSQEFKKLPACNVAMQIYKEKLTSIYARIIIGMPEKTDKTQKIREEIEPGQRSYSENDLEYLTEVIEWLDQLINDMESVIQNTKNLEFIEK